MRPEVLLLLEGLALWLALLMLVPKRNWRTLSRRLEDTLEGRRRFELHAYHAEAIDFDGTHYRFELEMGQSHIINAALS